MNERVIEETVNDVSIRRLLAAYADSVNRRAWNELGELFLANARIEIHPPRAEPIELTGPEALGRFIAEAIARFEFFQFVFLNTRIETRAGDDVATGRNYMCELRQEKASGRWTRIFGVYHDRFRRVDGRWWFEDRRFDALTAPSRDALVFDFPGGLQLDNL